MLWRYFDKTQCRQGVEAFFDRDVEGTPAGSEMLDDLISEHDDERMGPGAGFAAYEDGTHFEVRGFAGPKRVLDRRQIFVAVMDHRLRSRRRPLPSGAVRRQSISRQKVE